MKLVDFLIKENRKKMSFYRYSHVLRVSKTAEKIYNYYKGAGYIFNFSLKDLQIAALTHDIVKEENYLVYEKKMEEFNLTSLKNFHRSLWHGPLGAEYIKRNYKIKNKQIYFAVKYHTTGKYLIGDLGKIIFIADYIEPGRMHSQAKIIDLLKELTLQELYVYVSLDKNKYLLKNNKVPSKESIKIIKNKIHS